MFVVCLLWGVVECLGWEICVEVNVGLRFEGELSVE